MEESSTKVCACCGQAKELKAFGKDRGTKDGLYCYCRMCAAIKRREAHERYPERMQPYQNKWRAAHPEQAKAAQDRSNARTGKVRAARWRAKYPDRDKETRDRQRTKMRKFVADYKQERGCESCGLHDPRVLDLHHRDGNDKVLAVSQMMARSGVESVLKEMEKCRVLCANCHRIEHFEHMQNTGTKKVCAS